MAHSALAHGLEEVAASVGATDVLVYRRANGGRFVLTGAPTDLAAGELLLDDEPIVAEALGGAVQRSAADELHEVCAGYRARAAAVVAIDRDIVVVLGRRDGCLAGVGDEALMWAARMAAFVQAPPA